MDALPGVSGVYEEGELRRGPTEVEYGQRGRRVVSPTQAGAVLQEDEGKPSEETLVDTVHDTHSILMWKEESGIVEEAVHLKGGA